MPTKTKPDRLTSERPVVWVTGASSGIGRELAKKFASLGCVVALTARSRRAILSLKQEITALGGFACPFPCDIADKRNVFRTARSIKEMCGAVDVLVNGAGVTVFRTFKETSLQEFERLLSVNLHGALYAMKAVLPDMYRRRRGWIFNILSTAAVQTFTESSAYSATKSGVQALGRVLREEVRSANIRVTNVYPGATDTPMWSSHDRKRYRSRMMSASGVAEAILALYQMPPDVVVEEIVMRPIGGDIA